MIRAARPGDAELFLAAGAGDYRGAERLAHLDGAEPDAAGRAEHQQHLAGTELRAVGQREMGGAVADREGGRGHEIHRIGDRHEMVGWGDELFRIGAEPRRRDYAVARPDMRDPRPDLDYRARRFHARRERERRLVLVTAGHDQRIGEIDAGRVHRNARLARPGARRGDLFEGKAVEPVE